MFEISHLSGHGRCSPTLFFQSQAETMAIREERDFLSENERQFLFSSLHDAPHVRADGRELMQQRKVRNFVVFCLKTGDF